MPCGDNVEEPSNRSKKPSMPLLHIQPGDQNARVESQVDERRYPRQANGCRMAGFKMKLQRRTADVIGFVKSSSGTISAG
jgi:hypothetical protein